MLAALARTATRRPKTVILVWLLLLVAGLGFGTRVFGGLTSSVEDVPGSESVAAAERLDELTPHGDDFNAVVSAPAVDTPQLRDRVGAAVADVRQQPGIARVPDPYTTRGLVSADGKALLIPVTLKGGLDDDAEEEATGDAADRLREISAGDVAVSGGPLLGEQMGGRAQEDVARAELITLPAVLVVLLLIFGGLRAAALPLLVTVSGVAGAFLTLYGFSQFTDISVYAVQIVTMLGLGLAVDYALLMVIRFREERRKTAERGTPEDVARAVHATVAHAGRTVLFSGLTVAISLSGLVWFPSPFLRSMGLAASAVVVVDMLAALTLLPALLALFGGRIAPAGTKSRTRKRIWPPRGPGPAPEPGAFFARLALFSARRPLAVATTVVAVLTLLALPAFGMRINIGDARQLPHDTEARRLYDTVGEHYPAGADTDPVQVLIGAGADPGSEARMRALPGVRTAGSERLSDGTVLLELTPKGSVDGPAATRIVEQVRDLRDEEPVEVTGNAASLVDFRSMLAERAPWAVLTVLVALFALLFAFTGSLLLPLRTLATTLLSLGAALGVVVWVFQDGHLAGLLGGEGLGALSLTAPPLIIAIAFGLAMDYELFILSRMRETWLETGDHRAATVEGLRRSGRVVSCAALLLAIVFGGFMTGGFAPILQIGLGLTLAVLIDATLVRMFLVPATMTLLGRRAWWAPARMRGLHERYGLREEAPVAGGPVLVGQGDGQAATEVRPAPPSP
ncbi:putative membrane protein [Streptomyces longisporoflavus]|uniref:MMPL family transporter n=1 Tax=Streptomyces longisporoflavus TaxID=28044 RepID=UPI00167D5A1A|nr:MMPL family transporter [Streptomyces longisporoflavus]GGV31828.1 putative membrane protein [Streptomyces longisporoflavus]